MYLIITLILGTAFFLRRYKTPVYSIQKFSRSNCLMNKTRVLPLSVPWKVKINNYDATPTEKKKFHLWWFKLCFTDGRRRFLFETSAYLFAYVPYNPLGRTGVSGRGILKYWGPNRVDIVVFVNRNNHISKVNMFYDKFKASRDIVLMHSGYIDHPANTDNAWLEGNVYMFRKHDLVEDVRENYPWLVDIFKNSTSAILLRSIYT